MPKAVYIVLGSDYDINLEYKIKFIQELLEQQYHVSVYSVDMNPPPDLLPKIPSLLTIARIEMKLTNKNLDQLIDQILENEKEVDLLVVMDGLDFKQVIFGEDAQKRMQIRYPDLPQIPVIHFISPKYESPRFNTKRMPDFDFTDFSMTSIDRLNEFIKNPAKLKKIDDQIARLGNQYLQLKIFMESPGFNVLFSSPEEAKKIIIDEMTRHMCNQVNLKEIGLSEMIIKPKL